MSFEGLYRGVDSFSKSSKNFSFDDIVDELNDDSFPAVNVFDEVLERNVRKGRVESTHEGVNIYPTKWKGQNTEVLDYNDDNSEFQNLLSTAGMVSGSGGRAEYVV